MTLAIEPVRKGRMYHWSITQLMESESSDSAYYGHSWEKMLAKKRRDAHYAGVVESLQKFGFVRPLNAHIGEGEVRLSDGHHRIAAAIDLGMEIVPIFTSNNMRFSYDSGLWDPGDYIPTDPRDSRSYYDGESDKGECTCTLCLFEKAIGPEHVATLA